jgi:hypothetical protein
MTVTLANKPKATQTTQFEMHNALGAELCGHLDGQITAERVGSREDGEILETHAIELPRKYSLVITVENGHLPPHGLKGRLVIPTLYKDGKEIERYRSLKSIGPGTLIALSHGKYEFAVYL